MASDAFLTWTKRTVFRPDREEPYLSIQDIVVFVSDLERSLRFYVDQLGFELIQNSRLSSGERWIEVAPPDGSANLALVVPRPDQPEYKLIGGYRWTSPPSSRRAELLMTRHRQLLRCLHTRRNQLPRLPSRLPFRTV